MLSNIAQITILPSYIRHKDIFWHQQLALVPEVGWVLSYVDGPKTLFRVTLGNNKRVYNEVLSKLNTLKDD